MILQTLQTTGTAADSLRGACYSDEMAGLEPSTLLLTDFLVVWVSG